MVVPVYDGRLSMSVKNLSFGLFTFTIVEEKQRSDTHPYEFEESVKESESE